MQQLQNLQIKTQRIFQRMRNQISPAQLRSTLKQCIRKATDILFVHTSLHNCGRFTAGAMDVIDGLNEFCETLSFPTHTYYYPPSTDIPAPLFDPYSSPSLSGLLTEIFRKQEGVIRSIHSTHSLAASGPGAIELCKDHYLLNSPCGAGTPYERLIDLNASVLLFGVTFHSYTLFHTAEDASGSEYAYERETIDRLRVLNENGIERECQTRRQTRNPRRFRATGDLLEDSGLVIRTALGRDYLLYVPDCALVHEFLLERLKKVPDFLFEACESSLR